jgi:ankyrin repeat protein
MDTRRRQVVKEGREVLTAQEVLQRYIDEWLPEFVGLALTDVNQQGNFGDCPLHVASVRGSVEEVEALLAGGAGVNAIGECGYRPIHSALIGQNPKVVELLIWAGADLDVANDFLDTARTSAKQCNNPEIRQLIENA